jgi:hypothetical protein
MKIKQLMREMRWNEEEKRDGKKKREMTRAKGFEGKERALLARTKQERCRNCNTGRGRMSPMRDTQNKQIQCKRKRRM